MKKIFFTLAAFVLVTILSCNISKAMLPEAVEIKNNLCLDIFVIAAYEDSHSVVGYKIEPKCTRKFNLRYKGGPYSYEFVYPEYIYIYEDCNAVRYSEKTEKFSNFLQKICLFDFFYINYSKHCFDMSFSFLHDTIKSTGFGMAINIDGFEEEFIR